MEGVPATGFATMARFLAAESRAAGLMVPAFRSPPRVAGMARTIRRMAGATTQKKGPAYLHAPMPGLVVRINVAAGDEIRVGQGLVVMEAMKMENELRATAAGRVKRVAAQPGSAVEKGALLLEMEET